MIPAQVKMDNHMLAGSVFLAVQFGNFFVFWFFLTFCLSLKNNVAEVSFQRAGVYDVTYMRAEVTPSWVRVLAVTLPFWNLRQLVHPI